MGRAFLRDCHRSSLDLTFTTSGSGLWSTPQPVTVAAVEDADTANDAATLSHTATGGGYNSVTGNVAVTVTDDDTANSVPTVANAIADQSATAGTAFSFAFPANTFTDADNDTLSYTARKADDGNGGTVEGSRVAEPA